MAKELKSVEIWKRKQSWLERYEEEYDSRNIFRKEENTLVEYNNCGYNYNQNTRRRKNKAKKDENYIEPENPHPPCRSRAALKNDSGSFFQCMLFRFDEPRSAVSYVSD
jgi:hypothetical protein